MANKEHAKIIALLERIMSETIQIYYILIKFSSQPTSILKQ